MAKTAINIRLSEETLALLDKLAKRKDLTRTAVLTLALRDYAEREGLLR